MVSIEGSKDLIDGLMKLNVGSIEGSMDNSDGRIEER